MGSEISVFTENSRYLQAAALKVCELHLYVSLSAIYIIEHAYNITLY